MPLRSLHIFQTRESPADLVNKLFPYDSLHHQMHRRKQTRIYAVTYEKIDRYVLEARVYSDKIRR